MKLLILGANGFIGSNLSARLLRETDWEIHALDMRCDKLAACLQNPRFHFTEGDITIHKEWVEYHVKTCDVVLPLVAIATPATYVKNPLAVFELDFEANLEIVRHCVKYGKRLVFPSTSEVYGMSDDTPYDEETSNLTVGPISKPRWIYSCAKQMMDRVIHAYGMQHGLRYTLFRPFNWFGPHLDDPWNTTQGSSRVVTQFMSNILHRRDIVLVDGGNQKRCFLYIDDATEALQRVLESEGGKADGRIFNIGHPGNEASIAELAEHMLSIIAGFPGYADVRERVAVTAAEGEDYYGRGYEDLASRVPNVDTIRRQLGWRPSTTLDEGLNRTITFYLAQKSA